MRTQHSRDGGSGLLITAGRQGRSCDAVWAVLQLLAPLVPLILRLTTRSNNTPIIAVGFAATRMARAFALLAIDNVA